MERLPGAPVPVEVHEPPRASRLPLAHRPDVDVEIWMGGMQSLLGEEIAVSALRDAVIVDCTGDLAEPYRSAAGRYLRHVFVDLEAVPAGYARIAALVHELAGAVAAAPDTGVDRPRRIYVLCQQGMNRSGLVAGLLLRALGEAPDNAIELIRRERPGALSNETFVGLVESWRCPEDRSIG